jgi:uroporphyrinogen-III synthase
LQGIKVAIFEARMATELAELVRRQGGKPVSAPAVKELPLTETSHLIGFAHRLKSSSFDYVICETGVGLRYLNDVLSQSADENVRDWRSGLRETKVIARGPKPASVLREWGIPIFRQVQEPNTWVETLGLFDAELDVRGKQIALQEYGKPLPELTDGLASRGAEVSRGMRRLIAGCFRP